MSTSKPTSLIRKVYDLAKPYGRKKLVFVFAVMFLQGLFQVVGVASIFPFLALAADPGQVRDSQIGARLLHWLPEMSDRTLLVWAGVFAIAMLVIANGLLLAGQVIRVRYAEGLGHWLRLRLLRRIVSNPYGYFLQRNTGELLKKAVTDVNQMITMVLLPGLDAVSRLLTGVLLVIALFVIDPVIAGIAAVLFGGFYLGIYWILKQRRETISSRMKQANRGAMREAQQLLGGIKPVKIHQSEESMISRYARHSATKASLQKWMPVYNHTPRYLIEPLAFGGMVALVVLFAARGDDLLSLLPKLGIMALAAYRLLPNLQLLYGAASGISMYNHTVEEVHEEFIEAVEGASATPAKKRKRPEPLVWSRAIRMEEVTFRYPGSGAPLFDQLSLEIPKNAFVAFVGPTGCGKSTLVDLLLGLHTPESGRILVDETPLSAETLPAWRASIGYVPQDIFLLDDTIAANIAFGVAEREIDLDRVAESARVAQIANFIETELPERYLSRVGERGVRLSGGQRQRIGLARALYHQPSTLVLDEATSALDNETEAALMEAIEVLQGDITLVVIAHRLSTVEKSDIVFDLEQLRRNPNRRVCSNSGVGVVRQ